jgi:hypothetical protein
MKSTNKLLTGMCAFVMLLIFAVPFTVVAESFDGSKNLLCSPQSVVECGPDISCQQVSPASVNLPGFFQIDFKNKIIKRVAATENQKGSKIDRMEVLDSKLILQGADDGVEGVRDGLAWSMAIAQDTGKLIASAAGESEAFVIYGACTPR